MTRIAGIVVRAPNTLFMQHYSLGSNLGLKIINSGKRYEEVESVSRLVRYPGLSCVALLRPRLQLWIVLCCPLPAQGSTKKGPVRGTCPLVGHAL